MTFRLKKGRFLLLFLLIFLTGCSLSPGGGELIQTDSQEQEEVRSEEKNPKAEDLIWVHVSGQVKTSGVYSFPEGSRVFDAVEAAGGFTDEADRDSVNLAMTLVDEGKVYVASKEERQEQSGSAVSSDGVVNVNTATLEDLMTLPGIGEKRAEAILKLREEKGSFQKVEDLLEADGIKDGIFQQIKDFIKV